MSDDTSKANEAQRRRIRTAEDDKVRDGAERFSVGNEALIRAVERFEPMADEGQRVLKGG